MKKMVNRRIVALQSLNKYLKDKKWLPKKDRDLEGDLKKKARVKYEAFLKEEMTKLETRIKRDHSSFDMKEFLSE